jgi:hypothetical protein
MPDRIDRPAFPRSREHRHRLAPRSAAGARPCTKPENGLVVRFRAAVSTSSKYPRRPVGELVNRGWSHDEACRTHRAPFRRTCSGRIGIVVDTFPEIRAVASISIWKVGRKPQSERIKWRDLCQDRLRNAALLGARFFVGSPMTNTSSHQHLFP